jgi:two-component system response regulator TctD
MRILLVEDTHDLADAIADALFERGHDVAIHSGAVLEELLACAISARFDLVLLDLSLGEFIGDSLVHALALSKARPAIVLVTAADEQRIAALRHRVEGVLRKPFKREELLAEVDAVAARSDLASGIRPSPLPRKRRDTA